MAEYLILKKRKDFLRAAKDITMIAHNVIVQAAFCSENERKGSARVGFTATKKLGKAFYRNRTKRRIRAVIREIEHNSLIKDVDYVFIGRRDTAVCDYEKLKKDILWALHKTNAVLLQRLKTNEKAVDSAH